MTMEWIANRLQMGTRTHVNHLLIGIGETVVPSSLDNTIGRRLFDPVGYGADYYFHQN
jgi:hypothetical protein